LPSRVPPSGGHYDEEDGGFFYSRSLLAGFVAEEAGASFRLPIFGFSDVSAISGSLPIPVNGLRPEQFQNRGF
jgi:hypothetical protein